MNLQAKKRESSRVCPRRAKSKESQSARAGVFHTGGQIDGAGVDSSTVGVVRAVNGAVGRGGISVCAIAVSTVADWHAAALLNACVGKPTPRTGTDAISGRGHTCHRGIESQILLGHISCEFPAATHCGGPGQR